MAETKVRLYFSEGELVTTMRALPTGPQEAIQTQWGCERPYLANPTHNQLVILAHLRGVDHECETVCASLPPRQVPSGAT